MSVTIDGTDLTRKFITKWETGDSEMRKQAIYAVNSYIKSKLRERGIVRSQILPALTLQDGDLIPQEDPSVLMKYMDLEPDSTGTHVPFRGQAPARLIKGRRAPVYFAKLEGQLHTVNIIELKTYNTDLRAIFDDHDVANIQYEEDYFFLKRVNELCAANPAAQLHNFWGGLTKNNWTLAQQAYPIDRPIKNALMNTKTKKEFQKWDYVSDMGMGTQGADTFVNGAPGKVHNIEIIETIKEALVPFGHVYYFAPEDFVGKFYILQEPTTFVEQKKDWLSFQTYEYVGIGIGNTTSFTKNIFNP